MLLGSRVIIKSDFMDGAANELLLWNILMLLITSAFIGWAGACEQWSTEGPRTSCPGTRKTWTVRAWLPGAVRAVVGSGWRVATTCGFCKGLIQFIIDHACILNTFKVLCY